MWRERGKRAVQLAMQACEKRISTSEAANADVEKHEERRRAEKVAVYRGTQRGLLELDELIGKFVKSNVHRMSDHTLSELHLVLSEENPSLFKWLTRQERAPERMAHNTAFNMLMQSTGRWLKHSKPSTRAPAGSEFVNAWHDSGSDLRSSEEQQQQQQHSDEEARSTDTAVQAAQPSTSTRPNDGDSRGTNIQKS